MKKIFNYNAETGHATCTITYKGKALVGESQCHPEDQDFQSERVGLFLAEMRADILYLKYIRDTELKPAYTILNHVYNIVKRHDSYNPKSYENKILYNQLRMTKNNLTAINNELATLRLNLTVYIKEKEAFYQKIRKARIK